MAAASAAGSEGGTRMPNSPKIYGSCPTSEATTGSSATKYSYTEMADPHGLLEGKGKGRRHLKLHTLEDVENKHLTDYLRLAQKAAK